MKIICKIKTNAKKAQIQYIGKDSKTGLDIYKIQVKALPVKGKANDEIVELLANYFQIKKQDIKIIHGYNVETKLIEIGIDEK